ncbi:MAG: hypothetical protein ACFCUE_02345 [Candidatus Bathyarchaeia archaeon]|jgi:hypothetical protein
MGVKKKIVFAVAFLIIAVSLVVLLVLPSLGVQKETSLYTYPLTVKDKTYNVTLKTDWNAQREPTVSLINSISGTRYAVKLHFLEGTQKTLTYNLTIPTDLLWGNISLVWKYYQQNPDRYILTNNGTHNSLQMTFEYIPNLSGVGYFEIVGTEGAW